jgi:hypothetical protein
MTTVTKDSKIVWEYAEADQHNVDYFSIRAGGQQKATVPNHLREVAVSLVFPDASAGDDFMVQVVPTNAIGASSPNNQLFVRYVTSTPKPVTGLKATP